jgi:hypothetical protein
VVRAPLLLPAFALVIALAALRGAPPLVDAETHTQRWTGTVVGDVRVSGGVASFPFALDGGPVVRASVRGDIGPGERLVVRGRLATSRAIPASRRSARSRSVRAWLES